MLHRRGVPFCFCGFSLGERALSLLRRQKTDLGELKSATYGLDEQSIPWPRSVILVLYCYIVMALFTGLLFPLSSKSGLWEGV